MKYLIILGNTGQCNGALQTEMNALSCVAQDDVVSLRIICSLPQEYNIEEVDHYGNTALLKACYMGRLECARTLLDLEANIYAVNYFGQNALTLATYGGHLLLVHELLRRRSYKDFNLSSLIPAIFVAVMRQHYTLELHFQKLDPAGAHDLQTVHGLDINELRQMVNKANSKKILHSSQPTGILQRKPRYHK